MNSTFRAYVALKEHLRNQSLPLPAQQLIALYSVAVNEEQVEISFDLYQNWNHELVGDIVPKYHSTIELNECDGVYWIDCDLIGTDIWTAVIQPQILNNDWAKACYNTMTNVWDISVPV